MLEFIGNRRSFLKVGALTLGGLTLPGLLRARAESTKETPKKSVILLWLAGGPSHIDMYDLKPNAPAEIRGEFKPIGTSVPGIQIGEHLPRQARIMDKFAIVRSACHTNAGHGMGAQWMLTGYMPTVEVNDNIYPATGSVVATIDEKLNSPVANAQQREFLARPAFRHLAHALSNLRHAEEMKPTAGDEQAVRSSLTSLESAIEAYEENGTSEDSHKVIDTLAAAEKVEKHK